MKKIILILCVLPLLGLTSCNKQKSCDVCKDIEVTGYLMYVSVPFMNPVSETKEFEITATISVNLSSFDYYLITGDIPTKYQGGKNIPVHACIKSVQKDYLDTYIPVYKITCIEDDL